MGDQPHKMLQGRGGAGWESFNASSSFMLHMSELSADKPLANFDLGRVYSHPLL